MPAAMSAITKANRYYGTGPAFTGSRKRGSYNQMSGILQDIIGATVKSGGQAAQEKTEEFVTELIASTPFQKVLNKVHDQAEQAVTDKVKENGIFLIAMPARPGNSALASNRNANSFY